MDRRVRLVYENGVEFTREIDGPWYVLRAGDDYEPLEREPEDLEIFYTFRPVFYTDLSEHGLLHDSLLSPSGGPGLSQRIAELVAWRGQMSSLSHSTEGTRHFSPSQGGN